MPVLLAALAAVFAALACGLSWMAYRAASGRGAETDPALLQRLDALTQSVDKAPRDLRDDLRGHRDEDRSASATHHNALDARLREFGLMLEARLVGLMQAQGDQFTGLRAEHGEGRGQLEAALKRNVDSFAEVQRTKLHETNAAMGELAGRLDKQHESARNSQREALDAAAASQKEALDRVNGRIETLLQENERRQQAIQQTLADRLDQMRRDNEAKLEQMRATVDEKLQGTLEKRLGESFQIVSERLDTVHKSMGEMQTLATGVGDLKRVLINVKSRGAWGEVQLGSLLEDMLTPDQYSSQVPVRHGEREVVDYAVHLPGQSDEGLLLPIDCKFPHDDYDRLLAAQELGDAKLVDEAGRGLERAIRVQAKSIRDKYVHPPETTNFAVMYLPTEGLYAEVIRRPGLMAELQTSFSVTLAGPTTLSALLNSLRMGFRTLAIAKRSDEISRVLGEAKSEFIKYGDVWDKLSKQLTTAQNTVAEAGRRTKAVTRKLRGVEEIAPAEGGPTLVLASPEEDEEAA